MGVLIVSKRVRNIYITTKIIWCMNKENKYKLLETKEKEIQLKFPGN